MIEAVDWREYDTFFRGLPALLATDGRLAMQAIIIPGQRFEQAKTHKDFIKRGHLPGLAACRRSRRYSPSSAAVSDLTLVDLEDFGLHYAETLRRWHANLDDVPPRARRLRPRRAFRPPVGLLPRPTAKPASTSVTSASPNSCWPDRRGPTGTSGRDDPGCGRDQHTFRGLVLMHEPLDVRHRRRSLVGRRGPR